MCEIYSFMYAVDYILDYASSKLRFRYVHYILQITLVNVSLIVSHRSYYFIA